MASPVFKAMLSSNFREKDANEITLPGKKVNEFVDFLRQIYPMLDGEITLESISYIYRLADEYQMTKVMKDCRMFLSSVRKTEENAMDMLLLAQDVGADEARQQCYDVLKKMTLNELENLEGFPQLDGQSMQVLFLPMVKGLQKCIRQALPALIGSLDAMMYLWCNADNKEKMLGVPNTCPEHKIQKYGSYWTSHVSFDIKKMYKRITCDECRAMFKQMSRYCYGYVSPSGTYLKNENIVNILQEMMELTKETTEYGHNNSY